MGKQPSQKPCCTLYNQFTQSAPRSWGESATELSDIETIKEDDEMMKIKIVVKHLRNIHSEGKQCNEEMEDLWKK